MVIRNEAFCRISYYGYFCGLWISFRKFLYMRPLQGFTQKIQDFYCDPVYSPYTCNTKYYESGWIYFIISYFL